MRLGRFDGNIKSAYVDEGSGEYCIVLAVPAEDAYKVRPVVAKCKVADRERFQFTATFDTYARKRSSDANAYMWVLVNEIAKKLQASDIEIYKSLVRDYGVFFDVALEAEKAKSIMTGWTRQGIGWIAEKVSENGKEVIARLYYGTSAYSRKQMARVIDGTVDEAESLGIQTKTPDEIAKLVAMWEAKI